MIQKFDVGKALEHIFDDRNKMYALNHHVESGMALQGICQCDQYRDGVLIAGGQPESPNTFTIEGMSFLLRTMFWTTSKDGSLIWYVFIYEDNVTPLDSHTATSQLGSGGTYNECQDAEYDSPGTNRPAYTTVTTATATVTNAASKAEYTMAKTLSVYGAGLTDKAPKTGTDGVLMCAKLFDPKRDVIDNDVLSVTYAITTSNP